MRAEQAGEIRQSIPDLSLGFGPASGPALAVHDESLLAAGWCVEEGPAEGVYIRLRKDFLWDSLPLKIDAESGSRPRDLALDYDDEKRLRAVWTAVVNGYRRVFLASLSEAGDVETVRAVNPNDDVDADYPLIVTHPIHGPFIVWQGAGLTRFTIESVRIEKASGRIIRLTPASGSSGLAMTPHIVSRWPLTIGWYEILEDANELRISVLDWMDFRWHVDILPTIGRSLPLQYQPLVQIDDDLMFYACWSHEGELAGSSIRLAGGALPGEDAVLLWMIDEPAGDHRRPQLAISEAGRLSVAWQVISEGSSSIRLASIETALPQGEPITVSDPSHRFASEPTHYSDVSGSIILWVDSHRQGGSGAVGFCEVVWSPPSSLIAPLLRLAPQLW